MNILAYKLTLNQAKKSIDYPNDAHGCKEQDGNGSSHLYRTLVDHKAT